MPIYSNFLCSQSILLSKSILAFYSFPFLQLIHTYEFGCAYWSVSRNSFRTLLFNHRDTWNPEMSVNRKFITTNKHSAINLWLFWDIFPLVSLKTTLMVMMWWMMKKCIFNHLKRVIRLSFILKKDKKVRTKWVNNYNNKRSRISMFIPHLIQSGFNVKGFFIQLKTIQFAIILFS